MDAKEVVHELAKSGVDAGQGSCRNYSRLRARLPQYLPKIKILHEWGHIRASTRLGVISKGADQAKRRRDGQEDNVDKLTETTLETIHRRGSRHPNMRVA